MLDEKSKNVTCKYFITLQFTLTEHLKKAHKISVKFRKSIREVSVNFDVFRKPP